jgi:hypothetical protein
MFDAAGREHNRGGPTLSNDFQYFVGIYWGSERHRVCLMNRQGSVVEERWIEHSSSSLAELADWLRQQTLASPQALAAGIEIPRGAVVETLLEHGFAVFSINPKQLDRFREREAAHRGSWSPRSQKRDLGDPVIEG